MDLLLLTARCSAPVLLDGGLSKPSFQIFQMATDRGVIFSSRSSLIQIDVSRRILLVFFRSLFQLVQRVGVQLLTGRSRELSDRAPGRVA